MDKKEVKKSTKIIFALIIVLVIILLVFLIPLINKNAKIKKISDNFNKNNKYDNYYIEYAEDNTSSSIKHYKKENNSLSVVANDTQKVSTYRVNDNINIYIEIFSNGKKFCVLNNTGSEMEDGVELENYFSNYISKLNKNDYFKLLKEIKFKEDDDCYIVEESKNALDILKNIDNSLYDYKNLSLKLYIYKDTGLIKKIEYFDNNELVNEKDYKYKFNEVTDSDFVEPNVDEYEILSK